MKQYRVDVAPAAKQHIRDAYEFIHKQSPQNARAWLIRLDTLIASLETMPERGPIIKENDAFTGQEYREVLHHSHRLIFAVLEADAVVRVVAFRHGAQDAIAGEELQPRE